MNPGTRRPDIVKIGGRDVAFWIAGAGPNAVFNSGGTSGLDLLEGLSIELESSSRVLCYDRPLCGRSEVTFGDESIFAMWAEHLHAMLVHLGMTPAYVGGGSGGAATALVLAARHPEDIIGLFVLETPGDGAELWKGIGDVFTKNAEVAEARGMAAVIAEASSWITPWSETLTRNPVNRQIIESWDPARFASTMRAWSSACMNRHSHFGGVATEDLRQIGVPTYIVAGAPGDPVHPRHTCVRLHELLPRSEILIPEEQMSTEALQEWTAMRASWGDGRVERKVGRMFGDFIQRVESGAFPTK
jgi:pimeloyl-ACP methyl ester carboxylesterase